MPEGEWDAHKCPQCEEALIGDDKAWVITQIEETPVMANRLGNDVRRWLEEAKARERRILGCGHTVEIIVNKQSRSESVFFRLRTE